MRQFKSIYQMHHSHCFAGIHNVHRCLHTVIWRMYCSYNRANSFGTEHTWATTESRQNLCYHLFLGR